MLGTGADHDRKNSVSLVETRVNAIEKAELNASDVCADAIPVSEMTNQSEPTGLIVDEIKFTKMITVINGRKCSHVRPANTESDLVTVTNSTAAIQSLSEHTGLSSNLGSPDGQTQVSNLAENDEDMYEQITPHNDDLRRQYRIGEINVADAYCQSVKPCSRR